VVILVAGGAGFIGSWIVDELVADGYDVRVLDLLHPGAHRLTPGYLNPMVEYRWGDIADPAVARDAVDGVDAVCHQAAMVGLGVDFADIAAYVHHNALGTARLLQALHERGFTGQLVVASSMVVYGEGSYHCAEHGPVRADPRRRVDLEAQRWEPQCPTCAASLEPVAVVESTPPDPRNVYAATKLHQEHLCFSWGREHDAPVIALRYHNVYGPRMPRDTSYAGVASIFRSALAAGRRPQVFEDGGQLRDFVHVRDVAHANVMALRASRDVSGAFNVASGEPHTVLDMARALANGRSTRSSEPEVAPRFRLGDVRHVFGSPTAAADHLGFRASVGFAEGMEEFATAPLREGIPPSS
jgi:dTDP-L-rhamnose 4-epimerase